MKKVLLAGTAMGAASLIATSAMAEITVGAFGEVNLGVSDGVSETVGGTGASDETIGTDFEISFKGSKETSVGTASIYAELEVNTLGTGSATSDNTTGFDEFDISLEGNWGKVILGDQDGAADQLKSNATGSSGTTKGMIGGVNHAGTVTNANGLVASGTSNMTVGLISDGSDTTKITYMTPVMGGVQAGVSYLDGTDDGAGAYGHGLQTGVKFSQDMGGASVAVSAVYAQLQDNNAGTNQDLSGYMFGLNVGMSGFKVGFGYKNEEVDDSTAGANNGGDVNGYNVGVGYTMGDTSIGLLYENSEANFDAAAANDEEVTEYGIGVKHTLGEGVSVTLGAHSGEADNGVAGDDDDYDGMAIELKTSW